MTALLLLNDAAGAVNGDRDAVSPQELRDAFAADGLEVGLRVAAPGQLCAMAAAAVAERPDIVFAAGGDGTVSAAAGCIAGTPVALGVLPLGTLNHFARDLGVPLRWRDAVHALAHAERRRVDVGEVNGRVFINNCSIGAYAEAVRKRDALRRRHGAGKWRAMALASFDVWKRLRRFRVRIELPGGELALRTPFVIVANNRYGGHVFGQHLRPRLDEGRLWLYTTRARRRFTLLRLAWQSLVRQIDAADALDAHAAAEFRLASTDGRALPLAADGELVDVTPPLHFRVRAGALQVLAPAKPATA